MGAALPGLPSADMTMHPRPIDWLIQPFQVFAAYKLSGALLLIGAALLALLLANSPWAEFYQQALELPISVGAGDFVTEKPLLLWVNDGLMGIFFFHVGLEIKRELRHGELSSLRKAALPAVAAVGGMLIPALLYVALNRGGPGAEGWGVPMATDIAFALGVLALLGERVPVGLRIFLTALAIVDDIGAVLVIAVFYTDTVSVVSLSIAACLYVAAISFNLMRVANPVAYFLLGTAVWFAFLKSGVHATIAALLMAFTIPVTAKSGGRRLIEHLERELGEFKRLVRIDGADINSPRQQEILDDMAIQIESASSPLLRLEHALVPVVSFLVLPTFALANAGVSLGEGALRSVSDPIALGIIIGLFVGKPLGVTLFSWIAVRAGIADLPQGVSWRGMFGVSVLAGIGFTMSLFISGLAFGPGLGEVAKMGILSGSLISGVVGWALLYTATEESDAPQSADAS